MPSFAEDRTRGVKLIQMWRIRFQRDLHFQVAQKFSPFKCVHDYQIEIQTKTKFV